MLIWLRYNIFYNIKNIIKRSITYRGNGFESEITKEEKKLFCIKCGTQVEDDAKFCPTCGANLAEEDINKNDVKTFLLGTQEERERKKAFIKAQMEKGKKTVSEQMENGKKALSEQKKKMEEQRIQQKAEEDARRELEEKARQEAMSRMQKEREEQAKYQQQTQENYHSSYQQTYQQSQYQNTQPTGQNYDYTPISMWGYFGYNILFWIPFIGIILVLVFACGGTRNVNLRNYARSQFCSLIVAAIILLFIFSSISIRF